MACAAAQRDFCSSSLVTPPLGLSFGFGPTNACAPPLGVCSPLRCEGVKAGADWGTLTQAEDGYGGHNLGVHEVPARQILAGSCNRLGFTLCGGSLSQFLQRQGLMYGVSGSPAP